MLHKTKTTGTDVRRVQRPCRASLQRVSLLMQVVVVVDDDGDDYDEKGECECEQEQACHHLS